MRQRKTFLLLGVVIAILVMSVGYATIQDLSFTVIGNATVAPDQGNFKVAFTGTPTYTGTGTADLRITGDTTATMNVSGLSATGDKLTATFTVANTSTDITAYLACSVKNINTTYFKVTSTLDSTILEPQTGMTNLNVTVELIKTLVDKEQTDTVTVTLLTSPTAIADGGDSGGDSGSETTYAAYSKGDTVTVNGETFYVIEDSSETEDTVVLLAEYSINTSSLVQSSTPNTTMFSKTDYWGTVEDGFDLNETGVPDSTHYAVYYAYKYGAKLGGRGRLLTLSEAESLYNLDSVWADIIMPDLPYNYGCYWLGTAWDSGASVYCVYYDFYESPYEAGWGVRPVVTITKTKLDGYTAPGSGTTNTIVPSNNTVTSSNTVNSLVL